MKEVIVDIIAKQLTADDNDIIITDTTSIMDDLGADSLDVVEMLMEIEDTLGVTIPDADILDLRTVSDVVDYVSRFAS